MPNWNSNLVRISASAEDVKAYLVEVHEDNGSTRYMFNMHKLFPDDFPIDDPLGHDNRNYTWFCEHTGSKWSPYIYDVS